MTAVKRGPRFTREGDISQAYLTRRIGVTWIPHSHPGWWAIRVRVRDRTWEVELRYRREPS
jgi:hypothetical protein